MQRRRTARSARSSTPIGVGQVLFFTNAIDTTTDGLDIVALYDWTLAGDAR